MTELALAIYLEAWYQRLGIYRSREMFPKILLRDSEKMIKKIRPG